MTLSNSATVGKAGLSGGTTVRIQVGGVTNPAITGGTLPYAIHTTDASGTAIDQSGNVMESTITPGSIAATVSLTDTSTGGTGTIKVDITSIANQLPADGKVIIAFPGMADPAVPTSTFNTTHATLAAFSASSTRAVPSSACRAQQG